MNTSASLRKPVLASLVVALGAALLPAQAFAADEAQWVPGRLLVQPRAGLPEAEFDKIVKQHGGKQVGKIEGINVRIIQLPPQASVKAVEALMKRNKHLKFAERDMIVMPEASDDPYYGSAWHLPKINVPGAWSISDGRDVTVAILDSGVDPSHPDLAAKMVPGYNFYDNNTNTSDVNGHGTQVAGAAAAMTNNAVGVAGVAGAARIMPLRISSTTGSATFSNMARGVTWAADNGARVANISYQSVSGSSTVQSAANYMKSKGGVTVVAAGNTGVEQTFTPSVALISVSATSSSDGLASWSSYGSYVDVAAPGVSIWTTKNGGGYGAVSGTSFASPVTAGVVALMMAANPSLAPADIEKGLFATALDLGTAGFDNKFGHGRIDAAAAVQAAASSVSRDTFAPSVSFSSPANGSTVSGLVAVDVGASDNVGVTRVDLLVNGARLASDATAPFGFSWDSTAVADGSATLTAYAYDAAGNSSSRTVSVTVANAVAAPEPEPTPELGTEGKTSADTSAPVATISNPGDGSKVNGNVTVQGTAADDVGVVRMRLIINGQLASSANGSSLSYRWNTRNIAAGKHTVVLEAEDAAGNKGSRSVSVTK